MQSGRRRVSSKRRPASPGQATRRRRGRTKRARPPHNHRWRPDGPGRSRQRRQRRRQPLRAGSHPLTPWSLHRSGNRPGKGPIRYYGWFFYSPGESVVRCPADPCHGVWKGYEFRPTQVSTHVAAGATRSVRVGLRRTVPMANTITTPGILASISRAAPRLTTAPLDLLAAEDIGIGYLLCMNEPHSYTGDMARQLIPQDRGFGSASVKSRGEYSIVSGQEYRCNTYGHICLLMHRRLVQSEQSIDPNNWPVFGMIGRETRQLGGFSFHAHGGYAREIYADFAKRVTDGVELLQFAEYRGIGLRGWYRMLNIGYRFPALGACDYPYCRGWPIAGPTFTLRRGPTRPSGSD